MAATPQFAQMSFRGGVSGKSYSKDIYLSDVAAALARFDGGSGASSTSPTDWRPPEPVVLVDYSEVTGKADTTKIQLTRNGVPTGDILRASIHLTSLANRPRLAIPFNTGDQISAVQLT